MPYGRTSGLEEDGSFIIGSKPQRVRKRKSAPNPFYYWTLYLPLAMISRRKKTVKIVRPPEGKIQGPALVLANHLSFWDFSLVSQALSRNRLTVISNRYYFREKQLKTLLRHLKAIPKTILHADFETVKKTFQAIQEKRVVLMFPEGRLSTDGTNLPVASGIGALIKKLNVPLVFVELSGGYLAEPKWAKGPRRGKVEVEVKKTVKPEAYAALSPAELEAFVAENIRHDEYEFAARRHLRYHAKDFAVGLEGILYLCPSCGKEHVLKTEGDAIFCAACGFRAVLGPDYRFSSPLPALLTIRDWNRLQIAHEERKIAEGNLAMEILVRVKKMDMADPKNDVKGEGTVTLDLSGYGFSGTLAGLPEQFFLPRETLEGIPFSAGEEFEFYHDGHLYYFYPVDHPEICAQVSLLADLLFRTR